MVTTIALTAQFGSARRLVTVNATGIVFPLPLAYANKLQAVPGVKALRLIASAPRERLTRDVYNVGAFNPTAGELAEPSLLHDAAERDAVTMPYLRSDGLRLPEVLDDRAGVPALLRYRAMLAHLAGHLRWSEPQVADNRSPLQRLATECFEDARVDHLVLRRYPDARREA